MRHAESIVEQIRALQDEVTSWMGVAAAPFERFGKQFHLGTAELGHVHDAGMVDIPFTKVMREALVQKGAADPHYYHPESGWITSYLGSRSSLADSICLMRLSYLRYALRKNGGAVSTAIPREQAILELEALSERSEVAQLLLTKVNTPRGFLANSQ